MIKKLRDIKIMIQKEKAKIKAYNNAIEKAKEYLNSQRTCFDIEQLYNIFPELRESEDNMIREELIKYLKDGVEGYEPAGSSEDYARWIAWLEKQGKPIDINPSEFDLCLNKLLKQFESLPKEEITNSLNFYLNVVQNDGTYMVDKKQYEQLIKMKSAEESLGISSEKYNDIVNDCLYGESNSSDKKEPKFKVGDWVVQQNIGVYKVIEVCESWYEVVDNKDKHYSIGFDKEYMCHLWTIKDAKDGDILSNGQMIVIFKHFEEPAYRQHIVAYIGLDINGNIQITDDTWNFGIDKAKPASKEQCNILFTKMKEIGYEWDADKKELKKIEQKSANKNLTNVDHEYYSDLLSNDDSDNIDDYAYQCAYCMSHDWMKETATWEDVQKAVKLGVEWQKQKSTWSEEDDAWINDIIGKVENNLQLNKMEIDWLKSFKGRVLQQPDMIEALRTEYEKGRADTIAEMEKDWSEEDETRIKNILSVLDAQVCWDGATGKKGNPYQKDIDWLKSLKDRYTLKPSEEQIKTCKEVYADILSAKGFDLGTVNNELNRLEEQLKKLTE